jgi:V/A-type H+-transporting ATPase subunit A
MSGVETQGVITKVSGPLVVAKGLVGAKMFEVVRVGRLKLFGEIIEIRGDRYFIQVYEETEGIGPGEPVLRTYNPLSVELGPGLIGSIYDGIQRPLDVLRVQFGDFIVRGADAPALDRKKKWKFEPKVKVGDSVSGGDILGTVQETPLVVHKILMPPTQSGKIKAIKSGEFTVEEEIGTLTTSDGDVPLYLFQRWPVRNARPVVRRLAPSEPLTTGQRVIDMFFPIAKGGAACIPGPFGSGKTVVQHQLAKWADANIIVFVGCGERGNEMADVLLEFPELTDPKSGRPLMERTVLIGNTSNMPVAAREASVFVGITIAEYFRDMGYDVALMADSTSRWAEAMREISGRLEEMPGEEGYPAYLASRLAIFYERGGSAILLGKGEPRGSLSVIGSVSPPGGDFSEPVVQSTLRVTKVFWGLDDKLAFQRHFPAINWLISYSLYGDVIGKYADANIHPRWSENRRRAMAILKREAELEEIVRLVGVDSLSSADQLLMQAARMIREDFLHQIAFDPVDTHTTLAKQGKLLDLILRVYDAASDALARGIPLWQILEQPFFVDIARAKYTPEEEKDKIDRLADRIVKEIAALTKKEEEGVSEVESESGVDSELK